MAALPQTLGDIDEPITIDVELTTTQPKVSDESVKALADQANQVTAGTITLDPQAIGGAMTFDPANPAATKLTATIPVSKVVTVDAALTAHLTKPGADGAKPDFFGPAMPDAVFVSTKVTPGADGLSATIEGNLTLNGVTKPATFSAQFTGAGTNFFNKAATIGFHGQSTIKRSDFGLGFFAPLVADDVKLDITIAFEKKA